MRIEKKKTIHSFLGFFRPDWQVINVKSAFPKQREFAYVHFGKACTTVVAEFENLTLLRKSIGWVGHAQFAEGKT